MISSMIKSSSNSIKSQKHLGSPSKILFLSIRNPRLTNILIRSKYGSLSRIIPTTSDLRIMPGNYMLIMDCRKDMELSITSIPASREEKNSARKALKLASRPAEITGSATSELPSSHPPMESPFITNWDSLRANGASGQSMHATQSLETGLCQPSKSLTQMAAAPGS